jgi:EmrB/QacA subfamily drug resistance transporter
VSIDGTIVNVALPQIREQLDASVESLQWVVGAYVLTLGSLLLLAGALADRFGRKRLLVLGLALFSSASAAAGTVMDEAWLIAVRSVQGAGGAMMTPVALAIISTVFTEPGPRARAIGWWGAVSGIGLAVGPLVGGPLVDALGWRAVFWVNVPLGAAALILTAVFVPESHAARTRRLDPVAQLLVITGLGLLAFAVIRLPDDGISLSTSAALVGAAAIAWALVLWERRRREPLIDASVFRDPVFASAFVSAFVSFFAFAGLLFVNTFLLQTARDLNATEAALLTLPLAVAVVVTAPISGRLVAAGRARWSVAVAGAAILIAGIAFPSAVDLATPWIMLPLAIFGIGFGLLNDPINIAGVSELPPARASSGAALMSSAKQIGQLFGVSVVGAAVHMSGVSRGATPRSLIVVWFVLVLAGACVLLSARFTAAPPTHVRSRGAPHQHNHPNGGA